MRRSLIKLFLDCDGVLADFDKLFIECTGMHPRVYESTYGDKSFWKVCEDHGDFFYALNPMPDAFQLFDAVSHLNPTILTGASNNTWAVDQKTRWAAKYFPGTEIIVTRSKTKRDHMHADKHNIIVDDWDKYKHLWEELGGTFIIHTSADDSINQLRKLGIL